MHGSLAHSESISINSAIFVGLVVMSNPQTDRHAGSSSGLHLALLASWQCKLKINSLPQCQATIALIWACVDDRSDTSHNCFKNIIAAVCVCFSHIPAHPKHPIILSLPQVHSSSESLLSGAMDIFVLWSYCHNGSQKWCITRPFMYIQSTNFTEQTTVFFHT